MSGSSRIMSHTTGGETRMTTSTAHVTVVAVYGNLSTAESAVSELESNGFPIRDIYLHSGETAAAASRSESTVCHSSHAEGGIEGWFKLLFGNNVDVEAQRDYEDAFKS